jgi:hypothetical protein
MTENECDDQQYIETKKYPLTVSTKRLPDKDISVRVRDSRNETVYEFLFSSMKKYIRTNNIVMDEYWKSVVADLSKINRLKIDDTVKTEPKISYSYYKKYDDGRRGVVRAKTVDGEDNPREFYKEIDANTDTRSGIYWIHKNIFLELSENNINDITFHVNGLLRNSESEMDYIKECAFFDMDDFTTNGYYRGDKIYIREEDIGREITFPSNVIR